MIHEIKPRNRMQKCGIWRQGANVIGYVFGDNGAGFYIELENGDITYEPYTRTRLLDRGPGRAEPDEVVALRYRAEHEQRRRTGYQGVVAKLKRKILRIERRVEA